jgi:hypothetical protein
MVIAKICPRCNLPEENYSAPDSNEKMIRPAFCNLCFRFAELDTMPAETVKRFYGITGIGIPAKHSAKFRLHS